MNVNIKSLCTKCLPKVRKDLALYMRKYRAGQKKKQAVAKHIKDIGVDV